MKRTVIRKYHLSYAEVQEAFAKYLKAIGVPCPKKFEDIKFSWNAASTGSEAFIEFSETIESSLEKESIK